jgi:Fur family transcriptional regulator, ferric uptake regulator
MAERQTRQRQAIEGIFHAAHGPLSPVEVLDAAKTEVPGINLSTVYRTLSRLTADGLIVEVSLPGESARYESKQAASHHHHHFRCTTCEAVFDVPGCVHGLKAMLPTGFRLTGHEITLYGTCKRCTKRTAA